MKRRWFIMILAVLVLTAVCPAAVSAEDQNEVLLETEGDGVTVKLSLKELAGEMFSSLRLSLAVSGENTGNPPVSFEFDGGVQGRSKVRETRYRAADGVLNIYVAGTESLFQNGESTVTLGKIKGLDINGAGASFTVGIPENPLVLAEGTKSRTPGIEASSGLVWKNETESGVTPTPTPVTPGNTLENTVGTAKEYPKGNYTSESYAVLEEALNSAQRVLKDQNSTQEEKDKARQSVENAMGSLVNKKPTSAEVKESGKQKESENTVVKSTTSTVLRVLVCILCVLIIMAVVYGVYYRKRIGRRTSRVHWDE